MSDGVNMVVLLGYLGQDPELRYTQGGQAILNCRLATNESYMSNGERHSKTEWHTVIVWGKRGEGLHRVLQKGSRMHVVGRLQTRSWEDKQGAKRYSTEIVADEIVLCDGRGERRRDSDDVPRNAPSDQPASNDSPFGDDDIPF